MPDTHITDTVTSSGSKPTCRSRPDPEPLNADAQGNQVQTFSGNSEQSHTKSKKHSRPQCRGGQASKPQGANPSHPAPPILRPPPPPPALAKRAVLTQNRSRAPSELQHQDLLPKYSWAVLSSMREDGSIGVSAITRERPDRHRVSMGTCVGAARLGLSLAGFSVFTKVATDFSFFPFLSF